MESNFGEIMKNALDSMRTAADGDTVLGNPIRTSGDVVIIPVSKVSMGFASGGIDGKGAAKAKGTDAASRTSDAAKSFGGGGGSGLSVTPVAFLVVKPDGDVTLLNIGAGAGAGSNNAIDSVTNLLTKSPDIIQRFKDLFGKKKGQNETADEETAPEIEKIDL